MQAVEFEADVINGVIQLPIRFQKEKPMHLKIIALFRETDEIVNDRVNDALKFIDKVGLFSLNWGENKMTREQMNER